MSQPFLGEIRIFGFNFAPINWALCQGQLLAISQYSALFSLLGTTFGGNGTSNFGLPNLQGNVGLNYGQGPGLSNYALGEMGGTQTVTLLVQELPQHTHPMMANDVPLPPTTGESPTSSLCFGKSSRFTYGSATSLQPMAQTVIMPAGGSLPHNNMMPYTAMYYCICMNGIYPQRP